MRRGAETAPGRGLSGRCDEIRVALAHLSEDLSHRRASRRVPGLSAMVLNLGFSRMSGATGSKRSGTLESTVVAPCRFHDASTTAHRTCRLLVRCQAFRFGSGSVWMGGAWLERATSCL